MPGHKRNPAFLPQNLAALDMTEIPGMDVLSSPEKSGIIEKLQANIADFYGAKHSFFLVNGSSAGVLAAVCATCKEDETVVIPRNAHTSVYNALILSGAVPSYIMPEITDEGLAGGISPAVLHDMPEGATVLVVSPTYEGFVSDIAAIAKIVHGKNGVLIVDEAHGAHFAFHDYFPKSAIAFGADIVVQSFHKTLPALGQSAVLHISQNAKVNIDAIKLYINIVQTSSPSYILMSVCDFMLGKLWREPRCFDRYVTRLEELRAALPSENSGMTVRLSGAKAGGYSIHDIDPGKILLTAPDAEKIAAIMADKYRVQMEMASGQHILAMTSVADTSEGFARLVAAVKGINAEGGYVFPAYTAHSFRLPEIVMSPKQAMNYPTKLLPWRNAVGKISAQVIAKYPPGIAVIAPGERVPKSIEPCQEQILVVDC